MSTNVKGSKTANKTKESATAKKTALNGQKQEKSTTSINDVLHPTAESRIKKLQNMQLLADKHAFLSNKKDELEKFIISNDGTKEKITLSNAKGYTLEISNSQVVEEVTDVVTATLQRFLDASEKEILNYSI